MGNPCKNLYFIEFEKEVALCSLTSLLHNCITSHSLVLNLVHHVQKLNIDLEYGLLSFHMVA